MEKKCIIQHISRPQSNLERSYCILTWLAGELELNVEIQTKNIDLNSY